MNLPSSIRNIGNGIQTVGEESADRLILSIQVEITYKEKRQIANIDLRWRVK